MADDVIPDEVKQFILNNIDSIAQLEALLLLRNNAEHDWTVDTVAKRLYISEQETCKIYLGGAFGYTGSQQFLLLRNIDLAKTISHVFPPPMARQPKG